MFKIKSLFSLCVVGLISILVSSCREEICSSEEQVFFIPYNHQCINSPALSELEHIRVLDIGNSYTDNYTEYLPGILARIGEDVSEKMCLYIAERGGATFKSWVDIYNNDGGDYVIKNIIGDSDTNVTGISPRKDGSLFRRCLHSRNWDVVIIHQFSGYSTVYEDWATDKDAGYIKELIEIIRSGQPNALIGFLLVHSYADIYPDNIEHSSYERWLNIAASIRKLKENYDIDIVIPCGTAIENIRMSSYNNEYDMTCDGTHLAPGLAKYTAACCYYESIFSPITKRSILATEFTYNVTLLDYRNSLYSSSCVDVTKCSAKIAQIAAMSAIYDWYNCYNPEEVSIQSFK